MKGYVAFKFYPAINQWSVAECEENVINFTVSIKRKLTHRAGIHVCDGIQKWHYESCRISLRPVMVRKVRNS